MKKLLFLAVISLGIISTVNAQRYGSSSNTKFGAKAGLNLANMTGDVEDTKMLIAFQVGAYAHLGLSDAFAIQPEVLFDMKGADSDSDQGEALNLSYISVPILAKYMITDGLNVHLGPKIGLLVGAKVDGNDMSDFYKSTDFGLAAGLGYELDSGLNFGVRYSTSLSSIGEEMETPAPTPSNPNATVKTEADVKNSVITIAVGYSF